MRSTSATFRPSRIQDPSLRPLIKKLTVVEDPEFTRRYPAESCTRIEVATTDGRRLMEESRCVLSSPSAKKTPSKSSVWKWMFSKRAS